MIVRKFLENYLWRIDSDRKNVEKLLEAIRISLQIHGNNPCDVVETTKLLYMFTKSLAFREAIISYIIT